LLDLSRSKKSSIRANLVAPFAISRDPPLMLEKTPMLLRIVSLILIIAGMLTSPASASPFTIMFERTTDAGAGEELAFVTFANFADLLAGSSSGSSFSQIDVASTFNTTGLASEWQMNGGGNGTVPESGTLALLGLGLAALVASRRRKQ
jgi:hypothetical protein